MKKKLIYTLSIFLMVGLISISLIAILKPNDIDNENDVPIQPDHNIDDIKEKEIIRNFANNYIAERIKQN